MHTTDTGAVQLLHAAIRCGQLEQTVAFYKHILNMREIERPPFKYPGAWLATMRGHAIIHLYGGQQGLDKRGQPYWGSGSIDHLSLECVGFSELVERLESNGISWREFRVPATDIYQLFFSDPNGVLIEATFSSSAEHLGGRQIPDHRMYIAGDT